MVSPEGLTIHPEGGPVPDAVATTCPCGARVRVSEGGDGVPYELGESGPWRRHSCLAGGWGE